MLQRLLLALALGLRPRLLITDEPFTGLDPLRRSEIPEETTPPFFSGSPPTPSPGGWSMPPGIDNLNG